jgi:hypothetical protein
MGPNAEELRPIVQQLRQQRPDDEFVISMRVAWDVTSKDASEMADEAAALREVGVGSLHVSPDRGDIDTWMQGQEKVATALLT